MNPKELGFASGSTSECGRIDGPAFSFITTPKRAGFAGAGGLSPGRSTSLGGKMPLPIGRAPAIQADTGRRNCPQTWPQAA
jgi:hypothetical protein